MTVFSDILAGVGDAFERWGSTPMFENAPQVQPQATSDKVTKAVQEAALKAVESISVVSESFSKEPIKAVAKTDTGSKALVYAAAFAVALAGAAFVYRGISQNCSFRNVLKSPVSLMPKEKGVENEQLSQPIGWVDRAKSIGQRIAFPLLVGSVPLTMGAFLIYNARDLSEFIREMSR